MKEELNEMENINDNESLELVRVPKCIEVKMEYSDIEADISEKVVADRIGNIERNVIIKEEDEGIFTKDIDDWSLNQYVLLNQSFCRTNGVTHN